MRRAMLSAFLLLGLIGSALAQASFNPFQPETDTTVVTSASTTNANATLGCNSIGPFQVRVHNGAGATAFIRAGGSATTSSMPLPAGAIEVLTLPARTTTLGVILLSGTGNVYTTCGAGS